MALQIWLPLNGSIQNHGLVSDSELTVTTTPTYVTESKLGKAMSTGSIKMSATAASQVLNNKELTIAFWIYPNVDDGGTGGIIFGTNNMTGPNNRKFTVFQYPNANDIHWSWQSDENTTFLGGTATDVLPSYTWTHVCLTYKDSVSTLYINGVKNKTVSGTSNSATFEYETVLIHNNANRYINDFRIYDNGLSAGEVLQLSQALCLHYPCHDAYPTASVNRYSGVNFDGKASSTGGWTITELADERGYNYKLSYTGTGSNAWKSFSFPAITDHTVDKSYVFSCKVRRHKGGTLYMRSARIGNDWGTTNINVMNVTDEEWHTYSAVMVMPETFERSGTTYTVQPRIEFYTLNLSTLDTVYEWDFDIKDVMVAESDYSLLYPTDGALASTIVYDCSGLRNNGTTASATKPAAAGDSPRYHSCYHFDSKHYLTGTFPFGATNVTELTISAWINQDEEDNGGYSTWFACNGYGGKGLWLGANVEGKGQWAYVGSNSPNYLKGSSAVNKGSWYLHTYTFKDGEAKWYLNGALTATTTYTNEYLVTAANFTLGDSYAGSSWNTTFIGEIADLRIFGKALTQAEIENMYKISASLIDTGTMQLRGELIE